MKAPSSQSKYAAAVPPTAGATKDEEAWVRQDIELDGEGAVERFVDDLRQKRCGFFFKDPLGGEYEVAKEHARNCLEVYEGGRREIRPHHMADWVRHTIRFLDPLLVVYGRDVEKWKLPWSKKMPEKVIYVKFKKSGKGELKDVGERAEWIQEHRNSFEHRNTQEGESVRVRLLPIRKRKQLFTESKGWACEMLNILVPLYREAYPESCEPTS